MVYLSIPPNIIISLGETWPSGWVLNSLNKTTNFDAVIDGNKVTKAKPDPEVFLLGAQEIGIPPAACIVFEDAEAGLQAARRAGMYAAGIGRAQGLPSAHIVFPGLRAVNLDELFRFQAKWGK